MPKRSFQIIIVLVLLVTSFASVGGARASGNCPNYITVQWGDTLSGIAQQCGTTVEAIQAANPGLGWWVYAGQVLCIPSGYYAPAPQPTYGGTYTVQWGDTLGIIAKKTGTSVAALLAVNPQITNPSLIYAGQVIYLPSGVSAPPAYHPPAYHPQAPSYPTQPPSSESFTIVRITYKGGLYIRNAPGGTNILSSAMPGTYWYYNNGNIRRLEDGSVWVEVKLGEQIDGVWRGWMLVKDRFGIYFTSPKID
ncbi:MAG: LysM peptidoglycan-binding domain-containing protein [Anaerolineales bacterium]|nr:LysM peptidoglycan-binding domain-containing protein [Anaerolineales bacterium]